jgi:hypothetical protein
MPSREPSCLIPDHDLTPYRQWHGQLLARGNRDAVDQMDELIQEVERYRSGIRDALSLLHHPGDPYTYEECLDTLYELAAQVEALLPPSAEELAREAEGLGRMEP